MRGELMLPNFQFEIEPFWDSNHEDVHCIFLTFLENKRFFARTLFTSDYLSTLKLSMDKNEGHRFLNSWCSIFPDRCSLSLEVIFLALLPTWGENLLCLLKKAQQWEQQKSLFFLNSTFYRSGEPGGFSWYLIIVAGESCNIQENILKRLHIWMTNSHRLSNASLRILCSERRILQSPIPNEHPEVASAN